MTNAELIEYIKKDQLVLRIATIQDKITIHEVRAKMYIKLL